MFHPLICEADQIQNLPQQNYQIRKSKIPFRSEVYKDNNRYQDKENQSTQPKAEQQRRVAIFKEISEIDANNHIRSRTEYNFSQYITCKNEQKSLILSNIRNIKRNKREQLIPLSDKDLQESATEKKEVRGQNLFRLPFWLGQQKFQEQETFQDQYKEEFNLKDLALQQENYYKYGVFRNHTFKHEDYESLILWLCEIGQIFHASISYETIFLTVRIIDIFLVKTQQRVKKDNLSLIGSVSLFIASKTVDIYPIKVLDLITFVLHEQYSIHDILKMEQSLVKILGFQIYQETYFTIFDYIFFQTISEFEENLLPQLCSAYNYGLRVLLNVLSDGLFRQYPIVEVTTSCLLLVFEQTLNSHMKDSFQTTLKNHCLQEVLIQTNHYQFNFNLLDRIQNLLKNQKDKGFEIKLKY